MFCIMSTKFTMLRIIFKRITFLIECSVLQSNYFVITFPPNFAPFKKENYNIVGCARSNNQSVHYFEAGLKAATDATTPLN